MQLPVQVTIRDIPHSLVLENQIYEKAKKLDLFYNRIMGCRVVVRVPQKHKHQGKLFNVIIDLTVPGEEIVVKRNAHEDIYVALRDAFDDAKRQLEDYAIRHRVNGKHYKLSLRGYVVRLFPEEGYGFIQTEDGHEVYFNECVVRPAFNQLSIGTDVRFLEEMGEKGPQASRVKILKGEH